MGFTHGHIIIVNPLIKLWSFFILVRLFLNCMAIDHFLRFLDRSFHFSKSIFCRLFCSNNENGKDLIIVSFERSVQFKNTLFNTFFSVEVTIKMRGSIVIDAISNPVFIGRTRPQTND